jgi:transcription factor C subunit 3
MAQYSQQKDYLHRVSEKSLLYYPEEIRDLIGEIVSYQPIQAAPKDESIILNQLNPELEKQITEAKLRKRSVWQKQKRLEAKARKAQNAQVEQASSKQIGETNGATRTKRARLASLNDKSKKLRRAPLYTANTSALDEDSDGMADNEAATTVAKPGQISLIWTRPIVAPVPEREQQSDEEPPEDDESDEEGATDWVTQQARINGDNERDLPLVNQLVLESPTGEFSTNELASTGNAKTVPPASNKKPTDESASVKKNKKRVRILASRDQSSRKRACIDLSISTTAQDAVSTYHSSTDDDQRSMSEVEGEPEDSGDAVPSSTKEQRVRNFHGRQRGKPGPPPTLLERLTGLTGDPNDPIYQPPQRALGPGRELRSWNERKRIRINRFRKERQYTQAVDALDGFKKLFYTFIVASSLSGEDGQIDWSLVKNVYAGDRFFDMAKTCKLWKWMRTHMSEQIHELTTTFQSLYLEAYEAGKVAVIEHPETHDWKGLVQWAMRKCAYPDLPLPVFRQALQHFAVDESNYEILDRVIWYKAATADRTRTMLQLQQSFTAPIHRSRKATWSSDDKLLKARSWVRANTATPQALYDANLAHEKFKDLGETVLVNVVGDFVDKQHLRMRKLKRLLPGRNYNFTQALAKKYVRLFQLDDFMNAVSVKKKIDAAFADEDARFYNVSRCEEDGSFAAIMTMLNEGTVKLVPQLPPVNNDFDASLPKLSVWGFCEGGYNHRAIDRGRLFWDIHVVPTANYKFGNPLQSLATPPPHMDDAEPAVWPALPEPPLPGKHDADALLPIWSSIDGQSVTWPWWYRVLNLVLQPLIFLAGATAADIQSHCPEYTTELFEIELVLDWLESISAVKKTIGGVYITLPGFWAAFGDHLRDTEDDWFGDHVKRKTKNHEKQRWRVDYNLRHSTLRARKAKGTDATSAGDEGDANIQDVGPVETSTSREILKNPKQQYRIMHQALNSKRFDAEEGVLDSTPVSSSTTPQTEQGLVANPTATNSHILEPTNAPSGDVEMAEVDVDAEGEDDIDAEGEIDDGMY